MINEAMYARGAESSKIREIFTYACERKAQIGADKVFDFSLATRASLRPKRCVLQSSARWPNALPRSCMVTPPPQGYPPRARLLPLRSTGVSAPHIAWGTSL